MATNEELQAQIDVLRAQVVALIALVVDDELALLGVKPRLSADSRRKMLDGLMSHASQEIGGQG